MFTGCITAMITPFSINGEVDYKALDKLLDYQITSQVKGIVCLGTTGEGSTLKIKEKEKIIETCVNKCSGKMKVIVNTGTNCTEESVNLTRLAKKLKADGCLAITPYYNKPSEEGCFAHFLEIAKVELPTIIYHHPGRTSIHLSNSFFSRLEKIPFVVGIKEAGGDISKVIEIQKSCSIPILIGEDSLTIDAMELGAKGIISVVSNILPYHWNQIIIECLKENFIQAREIFTHFKLFLDSLSLEVNPQCIKYALSLLGFCLSNLRLPLIEPMNNVKEEIQKRLLQTSILKELLIS